MIIFYFRCISGGSLKPQLNLKIILKNAADEFCAIIKMEHDSL